MQLAGGHRLRPGRRIGRAGLAPGVQPGGDRPGRGQVGGEGEIGQVVAGAGRPGEPEVVGGPAGPDHGQVPDPTGSTGGPFRLGMLDRPAEQLQTRRVELVEPLADPLRAGEPLVEAEGQRLARQEDEVGLALDDRDRVRVADGGRDDLHPGRARQPERLGDVVGPDGRGAHEPDPGAGRQRRDLVDEGHVARPDEHRHDRDPAGREGLGLVGVEGGRRDEVVMEPVEPLDDLIEERALGFDHPGEGLGDPLGVVGGVGLRALGEEDPDEGSRAASLGRRREGGGRDLVGREPGRGGPAEHLGDDAGEGLGAAALGRTVGDMGAGAVAAGHVAGVAQALVDGPDRVRVDPEGRSQLADGRQPGPGQEPPRVDLVGDLPVDLGRDRDVRIALDVEAADGPRRGPLSGGRDGRRRDFRVS